MGSEARAVFIAVRAALTLACPSAVLTVAIYSP